MTASDGSGYGSGYGDGDGSGSGYGSGYGYGYGDGDGSGYGYGDGSGYGYGYGDGEELGTAGHNSVLLTWPGYLRVGCQLHSTAWWRDHWREVARREGVDVDASDVEAWLARAEVPR